MGKFLDNSQGGFLFALDQQGSPSMILYFIGDFIDGLKLQGSFLRDF